jgi:Cof subfamily protein (haloacid dehalogenase superfamily)
VLEPDQHDSNTQFSRIVVQLARVTRPAFQSIRFDIPRDNPNTVEGMTQYKPWQLTIRGFLPTIFNMRSDPMNKKPSFPPSGIQLVAVDLDGTLMDSRKELPQGAVETFAMARRAGIRISLITGRNVCSVSALARELHLTGPHASSGGALITGNGGRPVYARHGLSRVEARQIVEVCRRWNLTTYLAGAARFIVEKGAGDLPQWHTPFYPCSPQLRQDILANLHFTPLKITIHTVDTPDTMEKAWAELAQSPSDFDITTSEINSIEITHHGVNKGSALREIATITGIPLQHMMVIGDSPNDLPMFAEAGLSVAMGNATPEVKQAADRLAPSNDEGGALWAIQNLALSSQAIL